MSVTWYSHSMTFLLSWRMFFMPLKICQSTCSAEWNCSITAWINLCSTCAVQPVMRHHCQKEIVRLADCDSGGSCDRSFHTSLVYSLSIYLCRRRYFFSLKGLTWFLSPVGDIGLEIQAAFFQKVWASDVHQWASMHAAVRESVRLKSRLHRYKHSQLCRSLKGL